MKKRLINWYYDFLMKLEGIFGSISDAVNRHRRRIDDKYWEKYIK